MLTPALIPRAWKGAICHLCTWLATTAVIIVGSILKAHARDHLAFSCTETAKRSHIGAQEKASGWLAPRRPAEQVTRRRRARWPALGRPLPLPLPRSRPPAPLAWRSCPWPASGCQVYSAGCWVAQDPRSHSAQTNGRKASSNFLGLLQKPPQICPQRYAILSVILPKWGRGGDGLVEPALLSALHIMAKYFFPRNVHIECVSHIFLHSTL